MSSAEWTNCSRRVTRAETSAKVGRSIGRRLREPADTAELTDVLDSGCQVFALVSGGSVTAFRIEAFSPSTVYCAEDRLMVPVDVGEEWLT